MNVILSCEARTDEFHWVVGEKIPGKLLINNPPVETPPYVIYFSELLNLSLYQQRFVNRDFKLPVLR